MRLSTHHVIHRFRLKLDEQDEAIYTTEVELPSNAVIRKIDMRGRNARHVTLYAQCDNEVKGTQMRKLMLVGTGREFDACKYSEYITTFFDAQWTWHVFEEPTS